MWNIRGVILVNVVILSIERIIGSIPDYTRIFSRYVQSAVFSKKENFWPKQLKYTIILPRNLDPGNSLLSYNIKTLSKLRHCKCRSTISKHYVADSNIMLDKIPLRVFHTKTHLTEYKIHSKQFLISNLILASSSTRTISNPTNTSITKLTNI